MDQMEMSQDFCAVFLHRIDGFPVNLLDQVWENQLGEQCKQGFICFQGFQGSSMAYEGQSHNF
jgi:hypothetical protein